MSNSKIKLIVLAGSTRQDSFNKRLARVAAAMATKKGAEVEFIDLAEHPLPLYDGDLEAAQGLPENAAGLKRKFAEADGILLSSAEYNGSMTAVLKNTIDWLSRPGAVEGSVFSGKVALLLAASPGGLGGLRGLNHLRDVLEALGVMVMPGQRAIAAAHQAFDEEGKLKDENLVQAIDNLVGEQLRLLSALQQSKAMA